MNDSDDRIRLLHMLDMAYKVSVAVEEATRESLQRDWRLQLAVTRGLEIIGEAAAQITLETRMMVPQMPWADIIGMRNRLVHAYFHIDLDIVWVTATVHVSALIVELEKLIPPDERPPKPT